MSTSSSCQMCTVRCLVRPVFSCSAPNTTRPPSITPHPFQFVARRHSPALPSTRTWFVGFQTPATACGGKAASPVAPPCSGHKPGPQPQDHPARPPPPPTSNSTPPQAMVDPRTRSGRRLSRLCGFRGPGTPCAWRPQAHEVDRPAPRMGRMRQKCHGPPNATPTRHHRALYPVLSVRGVYTTTPPTPPPGATHQAAPAECLPGSHASGGATRTCCGAEPGCYHC